ncbi:hypothetical protein SynPROS71_00288 [Synechococcus sp. PROS-7-1]|uniref:hypothetical protein n=1 Tax=Synechococcus sp. PROS-7-1 TaxID=1442556 RepID=UPI001644E24B|nr:hypothetical protein [Synechococcus sp. PROS-7-1]QNI84127.1 hypothetical protein SynPROS71_00288 [Synechococcus sp. PROS-7-1]
MTKGRDAIYLVVKHILDSRNPHELRQVTVYMQSYTCFAVLQPLINLDLTIIVLSPTLTYEPPSISTINKALDVNSLNIFIAQETFGRQIPHTLIDFLHKSFDYILIDSCHSSIHNLYHEMYYYSSKVIGRFFSFEYGKPLSLGMGGALSLNPNCNVHHSLMNGYSKLFTSRSTPAYFVVKSFVINILYVWLLRFSPPLIIWLLLVLKSKSRGNVNSLKIHDLYHCRPPSNLLVHFISCLVESPSATRNLRIWSAIDLALFPQLRNSNYANNPYLVINLGNKNEAFNFLSKHGIVTYTWFDTPIHPLCTSEISRILLDNSNIVICDGMSVSSALSCSTLVIPTKFLKNINHLFSLLDESCVPYSLI